MLAYVSREHGLPSLYPVDHRLGALMAGGAGACGKLDVSGKFDGPGRPVEMNSDGDGLAAGVAALLASSGELAPSPAEGMSEMITRGPEPASASEIQAWLRRTYPRSQVHIPYPRSTAWGGRFPARLMPASMRKIRSTIISTSLLMAQSRAERWRYVIGTLVFRAPSRAPSRHRAVTCCPRAPSSPHPSLPS